MYRLALVFHFLSVNESVRHAQYLRRHLWNTESREGLNGIEVLTASKECRDSLNAGNALENHLAYFEVPEYKFASFIQEIKITYYVAIPQAAPLDHPLPIPNKRWGWLRRKRAASKIYARAQEGLAHIRLSVADADNFPTDKIKLVRYLRGVEEWLHMKKHCDALWKSARVLDEKERMLKATLLTEISDMERRIQRYVFHTWW